MHVTVITPPAPVVAYADAKAHLRLDSDDEQALVTTLVAAATGWIDGPAGWLGRSLGPQTLEARFSAFGCDRIYLPFGPIGSPLGSIKYLDSPAVEQTLAGSVYTLLSDGSVNLNSGSSWPSIYSDPEAIRIRYPAGYASPAEVPAAIKAAIMLMVGFLYENREASPEDALSSGAVRALLSPYRVWTI